MSRANLISVCRLCLKDSGSYSNLYEEHTMDNFLLMEVVNDTCQLDVQIGDGLPQYLCCKCYTKVSEFELFRRRAHEVNSLLLSMKDDVVNVDVHLRGRNFRSLCSEGYVRFKNEQFPYPKDIEDDDSTMDCNDHLEITMSPEKVDCEDASNPNKATFEDLVTSKNARPRRNPSATKRIVASEDRTSLPGRPKRNALPVKRTDVYSPLRETVQPPRSVKQEMEIVFSKDEDENRSGTDLPKKRKVRRSVKQSVIEPEEAFICRRPRRAKVDALNREAARRAASYEEESASSGAREKSGTGGGKLFLCDVCGKGSSLLSNLKIHMRIHTGVKPFQCDVCQKSFTQKNVLKWHKLTHTGERPYVCDSCGKTFSHPSSLSKHRLIHTGEKKHKCHLCEKAFAGKQELKIHVETHSRKPMYTCDVCKEYFGFERDLIRHLLTHESELGNDALANQAVHARLTDDGVHRDSSSSCAENSAHVVPCSGVDPSCNAIPEPCLSSGTVTGDSRSVLQSDPRVKTSHYDLGKEAQPFKSIQLQQGAPASVETAKKSLHPSPLTPVTVNDCQNVSERHKIFKCDVCDMSFALNSDLQTHRFGHTSENLHERYVLEQAFSATSLENSQGVAKPYKCDVMTHHHHHPLPVAHKVVEDQGSSIKPDILQQGLVLGSNHKARDVPGETKPYMSDVLEYLSLGSSHPVGVVNHPQKTGVLEHHVPLNAGHKTGDVVHAKLYVPGVMEPMSVVPGQTSGIIGHEQPKLSNNKPSDLLMHPSSLDPTQKASEIIFGGPAKPYNSDVLEYLSLGSSQTPGIIGGQRTVSNKTDLLAPLEAGQKPSGGLIHEELKPYMSGMLDQTHPLNAVSGGGVMGNQTGLQVCKPSMMESIGMDHNHKPGELIYGMDKPYIPNAMGVLSMGTTGDIGDLGSKCGGMMGDAGGFEPAQTLGDITKGDGKPGKGNEIVSKPYKCDVCQKSFSFNWVFKAHQRHHSGETPFKCNMCDRAFSEKFILHAHMALHKPFKCDQCYRSFSAKTSLLQHKRTHHGKPSEDEKVVPKARKKPADKIHKCDVCSKGFVSEKRLLVHKKQHSEVKPYECHICGKMYAEYTSFKVHRMTHIEDKPFKCDLCDKTFSFITLLKNHRRSHTREKKGTREKKPPTEKKPSGEKKQCHLCQKVFKRNENLQAHLRAHQGVLKYKCDQCDLAFHDRNRLATHKFHHTKDLGNCGHKCDVCGLTFRIKSLLNSHKLTHSSEKPFRCEFCDKSYKQAASLTVHRRLHTGIRPYKCPFCEMTFCDHSSWKSHKATHTKDKIYQCDICHKAFSRMDSVTTHKKTHSGIRPHKCDFCEKSFPSSSSLKKHRMIHTGEKPHKCTFCDMRFSRADNLRTHMKVHSK